MFIAKHDKIRLINRKYIIVSCHMIIKITLHAKDNALDGCTI